MFLIGVWFGPLETLAICITGAVLGELTAGLVFGAGDELPLYLLTVAVTHGFGGFLIAYLKKKLRYEAIAMLLGGIWQYVGMAVCMFVGYKVTEGISPWPIIPIGLSVFAIGTDIFLIPVALIIRYIMTKFDLKYIAGGTASPAGRPIP